MHTVPPALLLTWSVYGTRLQGDARGWHKRGKGLQPAQFLLELWHQRNCNFPVLTLNRAQRRAIEAEIARLCKWYGWKLWKCNARSNHVHAVISANWESARKVLEKLKANCTYALRQQWSEFRDRPVWAVGGDIQFADSDDNLDRMIFYVRDAQDRKHLDDRRPPR